jgi:hypothetical protein
MHASMGEAVLGDNIIVEKDSIVILVYMEQLYTDDSLGQKATIECSTDAKINKDQITKSTASSYGP